MDIVEHQSELLDDGRRMVSCAAICKLSAHLKIMDDTYKYLKRFEVLANE
jgi:hypothetical protein